MNKRVPEFAESIGCDVKRDVPLGSLTSFKIGGKAEAVIYPKNEEQLSEVFGFCIKESEKPFILGNGSNLLCSDRGLERPVIATGLIDFCEVESNEIYCGAGFGLNKLCLAALENSLTGLEFAFGIPGSVGGAVFMNAGAYGGEIKDVLKSVRYATPEGEINEICADKAELGYRKSAFSDNGYIITGARFKLEKGNAGEIKAKMNELIGRRRDKQPLNFPSAGSVFKRPEGHYAGALIEQCGLKGFTIGGAQVSEKHSGFIINKGGATAQNVKDLIEYIRKTVFEKTGVLLEQEIRNVE